MPNEWIDGRWEIFSKAGYKIAGWQSSGEISAAIRNLCRQIASGARQKNRLVKLACPALAAGGRQWPLWEKIMDYRFASMKRKSSFGLAGAIIALALFAGGQALAQAQIGSSLSGMSTQTGPGGGVQAVPQSETTLAPALKDSPSAPIPKQQKAAVPAAAEPEGSR